jgi:predicted DCC family thiol-disulfide oxidoreductase YuxK
MGNGTVEDTTKSRIILYDGVCGFCDRLVHMVLRKDKHDRFRFASLQSAFARAILERHGISPTQLDTVYLVLDHGQPTERLLARSDAFLETLRGLGGFWVMEAGILSIAPKMLRDRLYDTVAQNRYRLFGRYDTCMIPAPRYRSKFLDWNAEGEGQSRAS